MPPERERMGCVWGVRVGLGQPFYFLPIPPKEKPMADCCHKPFHDNSNQNSPEPIPHLSHTSEREYIGESAWGLYLP